MRPDLFAIDLSASHLGSLVRFQVRVQNGKTVDYVRVEDRLVGLVVEAAHQFPGDEDEATEAPRVNVRLANVRTGPVDNLFRSTNGGFITIPDHTKIEVLD